MDINVYRNVSAALPPSNNPFWTIMNTRTKFVLNPQNPLEFTKMNVFTLDRYVIFRRRPVDSLKMEDINGDTYITSPMMPDDVVKKKDTSNFFFSTDQLTMEYWFKGDHKHPLADLGRQTVVDVLEKTLNKEITTTPTCDIMVDNKKIAGSSIHRNDTGIHDCLTVTFLYDKEKFKKYLDPVRDGEDYTGYGITGVMNENPNATVDQFIEDYVNRFKSEFERLS